MLPDIKVCVCCLTETFIASELHVRYHIYKIVHWYIHNYILFKKLLVFYMVVNVFHRDLCLHVLV